MKVACICNMNNNLFSLTRYLRDRGVDAHLLLLEGEQQHFHPAADTYNLDYQGYTHKVSWGKSSDFLKTDVKEVTGSIEGYEFIIGCGPVPAFLHKAGRRADILCPFGGDIWLWPFFKINIMALGYQPNYFLFSRNQKKGIREAPIVVFDETNNECEKHIEKLLRGTRIKMPIPFIYTPVYNPASIPGYYDRSQWYREFREMRNAYDFVVFHHTRQVWKNVSDRWNYKGNDSVIKGFAHFVKKTKSLKACLVMFEYGPDVVHSQNLIKDLGIENNVRWFPLMARKDIMIGISLADLVVGDFQGMSWLSYGVVYEALAMGKPVMFYREDALYRAVYPELYPMVHARNQEEITDGLISCSENPELYRSIGEKGREWYQKYAVDAVLDKFMELIKG